MKKVLDDMLVLGGKYSIKRVAIAIGFAFAMFLGLYIVICDTFLGGKQVNGYAIQVFMGLIGFVAAGLGLTVLSKKDEPK